MIEVYAHRSNSPAAAAFVEKLRDGGRPAREGNSRWFDPEQADLDVVKVYHDGSAADIPWFYEEHGISCEIIPTVEPETAHRAPVAAPEDDTDTRDGHHVVNKGTWYSLIGPDGEKVGKSQRSEEEAWALMDEEG